MNVEMQTHQSCCCNANTPQAKVVADNQSGESFSAVFTSVSISTYFNPWTGENAQVTPTSAESSNSLQSALQSIPNIKLDPKSWLSPQGFQDSLFLVRTMAIRLIRQSQQEAHFIKASAVSTDDNQIKENETHHCECAHEKNTVEAETGSQTTSDTETASQQQATLQVENDHKNPTHNHSASAQLVSENVNNHRSAMLHHGHIHTSPDRPHHGGNFWVHSPGRGQVFTHFKSHLA